MNTKFEKLVFLLILEKLKLPSLRTDVQSGPSHPVEARASASNPSLMEMRTITNLISDSEITGNRWSLRKKIETS